jgi:hypothetical protein
LPEQQAREFLGKVPKAPKERRKQVEQQQLQADRQRVLESVIPGFQESLQELGVQSSHARKEAQELFGTQADQLLALVRDSAGNAASSEERAAIAAMSDHWWVEREEDGRWIAMDVLPPDARIGQTLSTASTIADWKRSAEEPSVRDADWHRVRMRVVVERYENNKAAESTVLDTTIRAASVLDRPIMLAHMPKPWPDRLPDSKADPSALGNTAVNVKEWVPYLLIGDEFISQSGFTDSGVLITDPLGSQRDIGKVGGGGFMVGFGEALGGGETAESSMTAEWIDYEVLIPGENAKVLRRPVFDLLGPANRSANSEGFDANTNELLIRRYEALLSTTGIFFQTCELTGEYVAHLGSGGVVANQKAFRELSREGDPARAKQAATELLAKISRWGPLPGLALWRSTIGGDAGDWYVNEPNILNFRMTPPVVNADRSNWRGLIDVASNEVGVRSGAGLNAFEVRLRRGVADTVAEVVALGGDLRASGNTASLFAIAGPELDTKINPRSADAVRGLGWPEDAAARLMENSQAGFVTVALTQPVDVDGLARLGWWRIDPESGSTIGVMDSGYNATDEKVTIESLISQLQNFVRNYPMPPTTPGFPPPTVADAMKWSVLLRGVVETLRRAGGCVPFVDC